MLSVRKDLYPDNFQIENVKNQDPTLDTFKEKLASKMSQKRRAMDKEPSPDEVILSSNISRDNVKVNCRVCEKMFKPISIKDHVNEVHLLTLEEYQSFYGPYQTHIKEKIYHHCKLCKKLFLLDLIELSVHLKDEDSHQGMKPKEFINKFLKDKTPKTFPTKKFRNPFQTKPLKKQAYGLVNLY